MSAATVPTDHTVVPTAPENSQPYVSEETSPTIIGQAKKVAKSKLKQKNRKQNELRIDMPITLQFEAATAYSASGFTPDADSQKWIVTEVEIHLSGKRGSETRVTFSPAMTF